VLLAELLSESLGLVALVHRDPLLPVADPDVHQQQRYPQSLLLGGLYLIVETSRGQFAPVDRLLVSLSNKRSVDAASLVGGLLLAA
jgi:hypothetical protein